MPYMKLVCEYLFYPAAFNDLVFISSNCRQGDQGKVEDLPNWLSLAFRTKCSSFSNYDYVSRLSRTMHYS